MTPTRLQNLILFIIAFSHLASACVCKPQLPKVSYCNANWVAHTRIEDRQLEKDLPPGFTPQPGFAVLHYRVKHLAEYRVPEHFNSTGLPADLYTPADYAGCGIVLVPGHDYILAGRVVNGTMMTSLCGQLLFDDLKKNRYEDILDGSEIPQSLTQQLQSNAFEPLCDKESFLFLP